MYTVQYSTVLRTFDTVSDQAIEQGQATPISGLIDIQSMDQHGL